MTPRRRKLLIAALVLFGGCGVGIIALTPGSGPPMLAALPPGDILVKADDIDSLWRVLETSDKIAQFEKGRAWEAFARTRTGKDVVEAIEEMRSGGIVTRWRASHVIGREAGISVMVSPDGFLTGWVAAFRIDTLASVGERAAGRLFMSNRISRSPADGDSVVASFKQDDFEVYWCVLGDLLIAANSSDLIGKSIASARAAESSSESTSGWSGNFAERFDLDGAEETTSDFRLAVRLAEPEKKLGATLRLSRRDRVELDLGLRALGLPAPVGSATFTFSLRGDEIIEEDFIRGPVGIPGSGDTIPERRPAGTFLWWQFRPGRNEAVQQLWRVMRRLHRRGNSISAGRQVFEAMVKARLGPEVAMALAEQKGLDSQVGGYPAEFLFFRLVGAESMRQMLEQVLTARSLGIYKRGDAEPVVYPYLVRHNIAGAWVYEMVIRNTRRHDGYRPSLAIRGSDVIFCSSFDALGKYLAGEGEVRSAIGRAWIESVEGPVVLTLDWQTPGDLQPLKNAYEYLAELRRFAPRPTRELLENQINYDMLWTVTEDLLGYIAEQQRRGVRYRNGMRMRARWLLSE